MYKFEKYLNYCENLHLFTEVFHDFEVINFDIEFVFSDLKSS